MVRRVAFRFAPYICPQPLKRVAKRGELWGRAAESFRSARRLLSIADTHHASRATNRPGRSHRQELGAPFLGRLPAAATARRGVLFAGIHQRARIARSNRPSRRMDRAGESAPAPASRRGSRRPSRLLRPKPPRGPRSRPIRGRAYASAFRMEALPRWCGSRNAAPLPRNTRRAAAARRLRGRRLTRFFVTCSRTAR